MRLLDLFCGGGGASVGYHRAGFEVVGVDIKPQKHYPLELYRDDAFAFLEKHGHEFDMIHASPPCQKFSVAVLNKTKHIDLLTPMRARLMALGKPWTIENVPGAPMRVDIALCGCLFQLPRLRRIRWFETSWSGTVPTPTHVHTRNVISVCGHDVPSHQRKFGRSVTLGERQAAMGIDWLPRDALGQAIPPAYTEWIGRRFLGSER